MERCACGRIKGDRGVAFDVECEGCRKDFAAEKPECADFTLEQWRAYAIARYRQQFPGFQSQVTQ